MLFGSDRMELLAHLLGKLQVHGELPLTPVPPPFISRPEGQIQSKKKKKILCISNNETSYTEVLRVEWREVTFTLIEEKEAKQSSSWKSPGGLWGQPLMCDFLHLGEKWMGPVPPAINAKL